MRPSSLKQKHSRISPQLRGINDECIGYGYQKTLIGTDALQQSRRLGLESPGGLEVRMLPRDHMLDEFLRINTPIPVKRLQPKHLDKQAKRHTETC